MARGGGTSIIIREVAHHRLVLPLRQPKTSPWRPARLPWPRWHRHCTREVARKAWRSGGLGFFCPRSPVRSSTSRAWFLSALTACTPSPGRGSALARTLGRLCDRGPARLASPPTGQGHGKPARSGAGIPKRYKCWPTMIIWRPRGGLELSRPRAHRTSSGALLGYLSPANSGPSRLPEGHRRQPDSTAPVPREVPRSSATPLQVVPPHALTKPGLPAGPAAAAAASAATSVAAPAPCTGSPVRSARSAARPPRPVRTAESPGARACAAR